MACDDANTSSDAITAALSGPQKMTTDGMTVEQYPIPDLIQADQYVRGKCAARNPMKGLRFTRLVPPGTV